MDQSFGSFADRADAGRRLAAPLDHLAGSDVVVLELPRGGVPVAAEVARRLGAPLDVVVVRRLRVPFRPELGMGVVGEGGVRLVDRRIVRAAQVTDDQLADVEARGREDVDRRARRYRGEAPPVAVDGRTVVVVDDGIATGSTARAACRVARARGAARVVLSTPVAPRGWTERVGTDADECVCVEMPDPFFAICQFYSDFSRVSDGEVTAWLERARLGAPASAAGQRVKHPRAQPLHDEEVDIPVRAGRLGGRLTVPERARGIVLFAHGSGSSRHSQRNRLVATALNDAGLGTLLFDLLTADEELSRANIFDVELLAGRLTTATEWVRSRLATGGAPIGYFGASTGAGAALWAAGERHAGIAAIVSRGGRPDLAGARLAHVAAPTLLIVGGLDTPVLQLNDDALARLRCEKRLTTVPGATHLFEEPGALHRVAELACDWFSRHFDAATRAGGAAAASGAGAAPAGR